MKVHYRKPTLIEQMSEVVATSKRPIDCFELSQTEFQSVFNYLDKTNNTDVTKPATYSFKGIPIKVADE